MVEEPGRPGRHVQRHEPVQHAGRVLGCQPLAEQSCRGDGASGEKNRQVGRAGEQLGQDREDRGGLADAGRVQPQQAAGWTRGGINAAALGQAAWRLLPPREAELAA